MCVALIGGMEKLKKDYISAAQEEGHNLKCILTNEHNFSERIGRPDAILVFTNKISHEARHKALKVAKMLRIAIYFEHSCGISTLKQRLSSLQ